MSFGDQDNSLKALVIIGEIRAGNPIWSNPYDSTFTYSDGQLRALYMKLTRIMMDDDFSINNVYNLSTGEEVYFADRPIIDSSTIFCVILHEDQFSPELIKIIIQISDRGGLYTSKNFYLEIVQIYKNQASTQSLSKYLTETPDPNSALEFLTSSSIENEPIDQIANLLVLIGTSQKLVSDISVFNTTINLLTRLDEEESPDIMLDAAFVIANRYLENQDFMHSIELFEKIADLALKYDRLAMEIASRIRVARISKLRSVEDGMTLLQILSPIDDGSLEVAVQQDKEEYYCLQGYAYYLLEDNLMAEDLYMMAILIAESGSFPSMNKAEAHWFIGIQAADKYSPEIATQELMTASSIAHQNGKNEMTVFYSHLAALAEIKWSKLLGSAGVIAKLEFNISQAEYLSWQALKRLMTAYLHSDNHLRERDIVPYTDEIVDMAKSILCDDNSNSDYALSTIQNITENINQINTQDLGEENENEVLKFLITKISSMIPIPNPVIMLIANDGRLILGGEIGVESWDDAISDSDDLFSGALSAIMAILSEVISSSSPLRMVDAGQTLIMIEKSEVCVGALLVDRDLNVIRQALKQVVIHMDNNFPGLRDWDGYSISFDGVKEYCDMVFIKALEAAK